ncbi:MAG: hypothetical protein IKO28_03025 [Prevotella sp.]|nr:hypothetical protein [Prevotella sp.]MBR4651639.1 hypothetical protein [Prevotella sp.]
MKGKIARWWQGRGFGVQSKTDYEYLKEVLKQPLPYYAYDTIKSPRARLIYRICNHDKERQVVMVGRYTPEELQAATKALGKAPVVLDTLHHLHKQETVIVSDITGEHYDMWQKALRAQAITWDMGSIGLIRLLKDRFPEHYTI